MDFISRRTIERVLVLAGLASVWGCGGSTTPPKDPELVADPPLGTDEGVAASASQNDYQRALAYIDKEHWAEAKLLLTKALNASPDNAEAHAYMGLILERENDVAGAEKSYRTALDLKPGLAAAATNLTAIYLSSNPPKTDEAIALLKRSLEKAPGDPGMLQNLGYALSTKGDFDGAAKAYEGAIAKGDSVELRFAYASALFDAKQFEKAVPHLKKVAEGTKDTKDDHRMLLTLGRMFGFGKAFGDCVSVYDRALKLKADDAESLVLRGMCKHELKDEAGALSDYEQSIKVKPDFAAGYYHMGLAQMALRKPQSAEFSMTKAVELAKDPQLNKAAKEQLRKIRAENKH